MSGLLHSRHEEHSANINASAERVFDRLDVAEDADHLSGELPVLCLHGERDVTAPIEYVKRLKEGLRCD